MCVCAFLFPGRVLLSEWDLCADLGGVPQRLHPLFFLAVSLAWCGLCLSGGVLGWLVTKVLLPTSIEEGPLREPLTPRSLAQTLWDSKFGAAGVRTRVIRSLDCAARAGFLKSASLHGRLESEVLFGFPLCKSTGFAIGLLPVWWEVFESSSANKKLSSVLSFWWLLSLLRLLCHCFVFVGGVFSQCTCGRDFSTSPKEVCRFVLFGFGTAERPCDVNSRHSSQDLRQ
jgi:hypothetical protein